MPDVLLLAIVAIAFVLGWFFVKRLGQFLEMNLQSKAIQPEFEENTLRIGFFNPSVADGITSALEQFSKRYSGISVRLFHGSEEELLKSLSAHRLDVIFLPENTHIPTELYYHIRNISLRYTPVIMKYGGLPIEPIANEYIAQKVLWMEKSEISFICSFIKLMENKFFTPGLQK